MALRLFVAAFAAALVFALAISSSPSGVSAHEHRTVAEDYEFTVGWLNEPTVANQINGLSLRIEFFEDGVPEEHDEGEEGEAPAETVEPVPVEGAEETLQAQVIVGGGAESKDLTLEPAFNDPGHYESTIIPTAVGEYTFVIAGTLPDGTEINETFDSGPETFSSAEDPAALQFPAETDGGSDTPATESEDGGDSDTAMIVAIVAIILAVLAAGVAVFAVAGNRRA